MLKRIMNLARHIARPRYVTLADVEAGLPQQARFPAPNDGRHRAHRK